MPTSVHGAMWGFQGTLIVAKLGGWLGWSWWLVLAPAIAALVIFVLTCLLLIQIAVGHARAQQNDGGHW